MDCQQYQDALNAVALGEESGTDAQAFRLHLEICEACRRVLVSRREFLGALDLQMRTQLDAAPSPEFNARLHRRMAAEPELERAPRRLLNWWPVLAGAAALVALLLIIHVHRTITPQPGAMSPAQNSASSEKQPPQTAPEIPDEPRHAASPAAPRPRETPLLHPGAATPSASPALKVRINRQELYATVRFSQALADGHIDATALLSAAKSADESAGVKPLDIPLIEMKPIEEPHAEAGPTAH